MDTPAKLTMLRHDSPTGPTCPAIYAASASRYVVGKKVTEPELLSQMAIGDDETVVEIPASLLPEVEGGVMLDLDAVGALFESRCTRSAFRMEAMDRYDVTTDGHDVARYLAGEQAPGAAAKGPWLEQLRNDTAAGKRWSRVHVLQPPLSDYLRYECEWGYLYNAAAGEDIKILDLSEHDRPDALIEQEFWILDDACVLRMHYDDNAGFLGGDVLPAGELPRYRAARDAAWAAAEPFGSWWARHPEYHRANRTAQEIG